MLDRSQYLNMALMLSAERVPRYWRDTGDQSRERDWWLELASEPESGQGVAPVACTEPGPRSWSQSHRERHPRSRSQPATMHWHWLASICEAGGDQDTDRDTDQDTGKITLYP